MNNVAEKLFNILGTKFNNTDIKTLDSKGKETTDMEEIEMFSFDFMVDNRNYGPVVILLSAKDNLEVYYGDNTSKALETDAKKKWENLIEHLSTFARSNRLGFSLKHTTDLKYDLSNIADITESYKNIFEGYYGTSKTSYNPQGKAKIIIKHSKAIGEDDARFRNISSLFIENADGERFKLPFKKLAGARAMARHVTEGGNPYDLFGIHISEMVKDINTLGGFVRRSKMYEDNEEAMGLVETGRNHYSNLRKDLKRISGVRGYHTYKESWEPSAITEQDTDTDKIRGLFLEKSVNARVEDALPLLARLQQMAEAQAVTELNEPTYKGFKIEVGPYKKTKKFIAFARNRAGEKMQPLSGATEEEALEAVKVQVDQFMDAQEKVSGKANVNLNAAFTSAHLRGGETRIWAKLIPGPKLVEAGLTILELAEEHGPQILKDEGFTATGNRKKASSETGIDLLGFGINPRVAAASQAIANARYKILDPERDADGNRVYDLEFDSIVLGTNEKIELPFPALTVATQRQYEDVQTTGNEMKEINEFENWADGVVGEGEKVVEGVWSVPETPDQFKALQLFLSKEQPVGIDAINATDALYNIIGADDLFDELGDIAKKDPDADARPVVINWIKQAIKDGGFRNPKVARYLRRVINSLRIGEGLNSELDADDETQLNASVNKSIDSYIKKEDAETDLEEAKKKKSSPADLKATGYDNEVGDWTDEDEKQYQAKNKVKEDESDADRIANLKAAIKDETPRSKPGEDHKEQYARHAKKIAGYRAEIKKLQAKEEVTESTDIKELLKLTNRILKG